MRSLLFLLGIVAATPAEHRSQGYAGSTPIGLDGYVASAKFDCNRINHEPRYASRRIPISADCLVTIPAPNGRIFLRATPEKDDTITLSATGGLVLRGLEQPMVLLWNPNSRGFAVNDSEGSGQVSHLRYFHKEATGWRETRRLAIAADELYRKRFDCRGGSNSYTNVSGWDWTRSGQLRVIVQEGVHSEGCLQPHETHNVLLQVIGNPITGRIVSSREVETLI